MILTNDTKQGDQVTKGQRTMAHEFFEDKNVMPRVRNWLMGTTVLIKSGLGKGSGVIIDVDKDNVYVLSAKHVLYILDGRPSPEKKNSPGQNWKPADYVDADFLNTIQIGYDPGALLSAPAKSAKVTGLDFTGNDDQTWEYDIVVFT